MSPRFYAPPNADGLKPWLVTVTTWGRDREEIVYAASARDASYIAKGRMLYTYAKSRRATEDDVRRLA